MKIYFACSIVGGRKDEEIYKEFVDRLIQDGHQVLTEVLVRDDVIQLESNIDPVEVYKRDINWINESDVLIAEVSTPSHGVGYEIGFALNQAKPVICLYQVGVPVSKMILGNQDPKMSLFAYKDIDIAHYYIKQQLKRIQKEV